VCAVHNVAVFCSSLTSCFPGMLLTYFLNDFEIVPVAHIISGITFVFTFHSAVFIIIIIIITIISFMQGIYTYIPETNYVPREYSVAAILLLLFMVHISLVSVLNLLYFYISTFWSMCAVPSSPMTVFCGSFI